jgi:predicted TIM-barrel fold metal-dependent hydrolase
MSIFDVHVHVQPKEMLLPDVRAVMFRDSNVAVAEQLASADALLRHLDGEGVERICCINYVAPDVMGFTAATNDWIAAFTKEHRDRLLPVGSVNPRFTDDVRSETERILELGIRMIKIHPPHQRFAANAYLHEWPRLAELYSICQERGVPVMFHTGTSIFPKARNVFADPMAVDDVAVDFPELKIILAHAGRPLYGDSAVFLARRHRNVHLDLSGIPPRAIPKYVPRFEELTTKCLWGTDWPSPGVTSMAANIAAFRELPLTPEQQQAVLGGNAARLFD